MKTRNSTGGIDRCQVDMQAIWLKDDISAIVKMLATIFLICCETQINEVDFRKMSLNHLIVLAKRGTVDGRDPLETALELARHP